MLQSMTSFVKQLKQDYFLSYLYLYILILPWDVWKPQIGVFSTILLIWWLLVGKKRGYFKKLKELIKIPTIQALGVFFLYAFVSLLWSDNYNDAFNTFFRFFKYTLIIIPVFYTSLSPEHIKYALYTLSISLLFYALFSIGIYLEFYSVYDSTKTNPKGIMAYAIVTPYMVIATLFFTIFSFFTNKRKKVLFLVFAAISFFALFINNGRAAQLAFFLTLLSLSFLFRKELLNNLTALLSFFLILMLSIILLYNFNKLDRFINAFSELQNPQEKNFAGSWGKREYLLFAAGQIIKKHPILGIGVGDNIDALKQYENTHPSEADYLRTFHNQHLDILTRFGIIGYLLFIIPFILLLYKLRTNKLYFLLAFSFFSVTFFDSLGDIILLIKPYNNLFILLFILFCIIAYQKKDPDKLQSFFN